VDKLYSLQDASRLLGMPRRVIDSLIDAGFVQPTSGPRNTRRLGFQDLVVLRAAQSLAAAHVPATRIARTLARLREQLPDVPPGRLRVEAVGKAIVVRENAQRWHADSGQYLLAFDVTAEHGEVRFIGRRSEPAQEEDWFERGVAQEEREPAAAQDSYRRAIEHDATCSGAYANLGRLLHAAGRLDEAQAVYETALRLCTADATLLFNLAVLLEERGHLGEAERRYREALDADPAFADAHCNLGLLYERTGNAQAALRHLAAYRHLSRTR
jgi:tetratricopeptide (TPR) repeat protein